MKKTTHAIEAEFGLKRCKFCGLCKTYWIIFPTCTLATWVRFLIIKLECLMFGHGPQLLGRCFYCGKELHK